VCVSLLKKGRGGLNYIYTPPVGGTLLLLLSAKGKNRESSKGRKRGERLDWDFTRVEK